MNVTIEEELRESELRFRLMADSIPQIVWIVDDTGRAVYFNKQWAIYTGVAPANTTPSQVTADFVHPDDRAATAQAWESAFQTGQVYTVEHRIRSARGDYRWFLVRAEPYRDPQSGKITRWFGTSTDVHDRKLAEAALRASEERYRSLFTSIDEGFCIIDVLFDDQGRPIDYRFCEINPSFEQQTGLVGAKGKTMRELAPAHESHWYEIYGRVAETGESIRFVNEAKALDRWFDVFAFRVKDDGGCKVAVLFKDISDRVKSEDALLQADRRKDEFLAMLAHELRNPLAPIAAAAHLLGMGRLDEAHIRQTSSVIARQVKHMTGLVDDLLDVSRVTRGLVELDKAKLNARKILSDAVEQVRPLIDVRRHRLAVHMPPAPAFVLGDAKRLVQVVANLLNNAAKYTPAGGDIGLGLEVEGGEVKIVVSDNGVGMAPELQARAFELFAQAARSPDRSQGGLGIGLALVKSLVGLHGGSIAVHSDGLGMGSRFLVTLPRLAEDVDGPGARPDVRSFDAPGKALKVMVVDDNVDAAEMLAMFLETLGHRVFVEQHPYTALDRARDEAPDVCLLDIGLPGMDGNELARRLRSQPETAKALLVAVTGYGQEQDREIALAAGFDHHLAKPVDSARLISLLDELADRRERL